jgi:hypothetical protein
VSLHDLSLSFCCASDYVGRSRTPARSFCLSWSACFREGQLKTCNRFTHIRSGLLYLPDHLCYTFCLVTFACRTGVPTRNLIDSEALLYQSNFAIRWSLRKCFNVSYRRDMNTIMTMPWPAWLKIWTSIASAFVAQKGVRPTAHSLILVSRTFHKTRHCSTGPVFNLHAI